MGRAFFLSMFVLIASFSMESHSQTRSLASFAINLEERANCHPELGCPSNAKTQSRFRLSDAAERFNEGFMRVRSSMRPSYATGSRRPIRVIFDFEDGLGLAFPVFDSSVVFIENRFKFFNEDSQCISFKMRY